MLDNKQYAAFGSRDDISTIEINHPLFTATVLTQGAQLIEFSSKSESENQTSNWLWLSEQANYTLGKSVRGGVPICWPWFGSLDRNPLPIQAHVHSDSAHGFARTKHWQIKNVIELQDQVELVMVLNHDNETVKIWPYEFELTAHFIFKQAEVNIELRTHNLSMKDMAFSQALHTYFPTSDISTTKIEGFDSESYLETLESDWPEKTQKDAIEFTGETDRIYLPNKDRNHDKHYYMLELITAERKYLLENHNSQSCVVWNPWIEKSKSLSDFADDAYQRMFCVETANCANDFVTLKPQESHSLALSIRCH